MKILLQRVSEASVEVDNETIGKIGLGWLALIGIAETDTQEIVDKMCETLLNLRVFSDSDGKFNLSVLDVEGSVLAIGQFTLYANCKKGRRPSFTSAANPELANKLYQYTTEVLERSLPVERGSFGSHMKVSLLNDGPVTIMLDSDEIL